MFSSVLQRKKSFALKVILLIWCQLPLHKTKAIKVWLYNGIILSLWKKGCWLSSPEWCLSANSKLLNQSCLLCLSVAIVCNPLQRHLLIFWLISNFHMHNFLFCQSDVYVGCWHGVGQWLWPCMRQKGCSFPWHIKALGGCFTKRCCSSLVVTQPLA